jgi:hypothetical protein
MIDRTRVTVAEARSSATRGDSIAMRGPRRGFIEDVLEVSAIDSCAKVQLSLDPIAGCTQPSPSEALERDPARPPRPMGIRSPREWAARDLMVSATGAALAVLHNLLAMRQVHSRGARHLRKRVAEWAVRPRREDTASASATRSPAAHLDQFTQARAGRPTASRGSAVLAIAPSSDRAATARHLEAASRGEGPATTFTVRLPVPRVTPAPCRAEHAR